MHIEYNGVHLELSQLDRVERVNVYSSDGQDLMYVKWIVGATCIYAPGGYPVGTAATSLSGSTLRDLNRLPAPNDLHGTDPRLNAVAQTSNAAGEWTHPSYPAITTDAELYTRLMTPRGKFRIWAWSVDGTQQVTWLESPKPGLRVDVAGGPKPISCDIVKATGDGLNFGVHFQIETCLSPCPNGSDRLILSHRWEMTHEHDEDQYLTRIIRGEVVFNMALLNLHGFNPDWLRSQFLHPIPLGMKRQAPTVTQSSDGSTIKYEVADTDTSITFDAGDSGATEMDIVEHLTYTQPWMHPVEALL